MSCATDTEPITTREWTHPATGQVRHYINIEQPGLLETDRYKTGNIRYASLRGETISNRQANLALTARTWCDQHGTFHVDRYTGNLNLADEIQAAITERGLDYLA